MNVILDKNQYIFVPAPLGQGQIIFSNLPFLLLLENIVEIINVSDDKSINVYNPTKTGLRGSIVGQTLTLETNTAGMSIGDDLQITLSLSQTQLNASANINPNIFRFLDTNGDGTGITNAIGNYSVVAEEFFIQHQIGDPPLFLSRLLIHISDFGAVDAGSYGNGIVLTNGIIFEKQNAGGLTLIDYCNGFPIKTNGDYAVLAYDVENTSFGAGLNYVRVRWSFRKESGFIKLDNGEKFVVKLNDSFVGLVQHLFFIKGYQ